MPVKPVPEINGFELKLGTHHYLFRECEGPFNNISSCSIAADKYCTNKLLEQKGIPVPNALSLHIDDFNKYPIDELITDLNFPLVIKPLLNSSQGKDVLCNIQTIEELKLFLTHYFSIYDYLMIEEFHGKLKSYRVLVFNGKIMGIVLRHPASVIGDGKHTIEELVNLTNIERKKISDFLGPIVLDDECKIKLKELGAELDYIPLTGEKIVLCYTSNATRGGTYESLGNKMCKENRKLMAKVASVLNLTLTGIDVECKDINLPITQSNGVILEVNHRPSVRIHEIPLNGKPHFVTRKIMRSFIYRHPLSYLYSLYLNKSTAFYIRATIFIIIIGIFYSVAV